MDQKNIKGEFRNNAVFGGHQKSGTKPNTSFKPGGNRSSVITKGSDQFKARMVYVNDQIKAPNIMIIDDEKNNLGTFPRRVALEMASESGLDLVQLVYDPEKMLSTVRMTDYGKYMYQKSKEEKEKRKVQKSKEMKELRLSYGIGDNDLHLKIKKGREFLEDGNNVKFSIRLRGRERIYEERAKERLSYVQDQLLDYGKSQYSTPKKEANGYSIILFSK